MNTLVSASLVALLLQAIGATLMGVLSLLLPRPAKSSPLRYWAFGWLSLAAALASLFLSFTYGWWAEAGKVVYIVGEYAFGYLLIAGCRFYAGGPRLRRREAWLVAPAVAMAVGLTWASNWDFNVFFSFHTLIYAYLFFTAFRMLRHAPPRRPTLLGLRVTKVALALLALNYLHYGPLFAMSAMGVLAPTLPYLVYSPLYDLMLLVMLMFGMVMLMTGGVQHELELANERLAQALDRLEKLAQMDHLTSALNRHAFYTLIERPRGSSGTVLSGCAALADIDNLKTINDHHGHAAGDAAIRAVASGIRACIRADDLLFRWGGDEFVVLLIGMTEADARQRFASLNDRLKGAARAGEQPIELTVSMGFAAFEGAPSLDEVIAMADRAMYGRKRKD